MTSRPIVLKEVLNEDQLACSIARKWILWHMLRQNKLQVWNEVKEYVFATDTTHTTNAKLPWSNKTTLPKLTQIRDNLYANYMATLFPKRRWMFWEGATKQDEKKTKTRAIRDYASMFTKFPSFKQELSKLVLDYIDTGNCFVMPVWTDNTSVDKSDNTKVGYIGPEAKRISPFDIVFDPTASSFAKAPKIVRSLMTIGEAKKYLVKVSSNPEDTEVAKKAFDEMYRLRGLASQWGASELSDIDGLYSIDGFTSYRAYLDSDYVEVLSLYGDIYDREKDEFLENHQIVVIDRHIIASKRSYPYPMAEIPMFHAGWRPRQDNVWAMGPLENLVGLQYRLDHVENMKSDLMDLTVFPPLMVKGVVSDFEWSPFSRIYTDTDGDVELKSPDVNALQVNVEISSIMQTMEEMAGSPKEAMGFRTPGEKTAYEVQRLENAASRIFQNKISQFEEQIIEPLLNSMLVLAQQHLDDTTIRVIEDEFNVVNFKQITRNDIAANGRLKPVGARHFAEKAEIVQNLNNFAQSALGQDEGIKVHFSTIKLAEMVEELLDLQDFELVKPYIRLSEQADMQRQSMANEENVLSEAAVPAGLDGGDPV